MPISVHPVDGLISRLLQQYQRTAGGQSASRPSASAHAQPDHISLSDIARHATGTGANSGQLESSLLYLYNQRGDM
jgi:hypothetical protein